MESGAIQKSKKSMLEIKNLTKSYGRKVALKSISLSIERGEIFGLLGPNGAGKTTTLKILAGLLQADAGEIFFKGQKFSRENYPLRFAVAYAPDQSYLYGKLTGEEHINFYADLYHLPKEKREKINFFFEFFEFEEFRHLLVETYSAGTKQKLLLAQALLVEPELLLLDEPLISIDPLVSRKIRLYLQDCARQKMAIIFATHILSFASQICTRIGIIIDSRIITCGTVEQLLAEAGQTDLEEFYFRKVMEYAASDQGKI